MNSLIELLKSVFSIKSNKLLITFIVFCQKLIFNNILLIKYIHYFIKFRNFVKNCKMLIFNFFIQKY